MMQLVNIDSEVAMFFQVPEYCDKEVLNKWSMKKAELKK